MVVGHSFGGLITQITAGRGLSRASVAIDPAPFRGVLPLPLSSLRAASAVLANPANYHRAVPLTYEQFRYSFANTVGEKEARELYDTYAVPAPGEPLFQAAAANVSPWTEAKVDTTSADRGPRTAADHLRGTGPHRPLDPRRRRVQEAGPQRPRRHGSPRSPAAVTP
ncbi:hypothetical protein [Streptomyces sp. NBC_00233]|uniref:hypothetical protein n=1 Tax=Streptomyces sp. NBC_00233 TaxID=2975686 RepID=UPI002256CAA2|nr:hypothetical protein [Streptomyces sp. NBC_00233]MCX5230852.1 hypothetical protein [Streptomyces sp. NBC_00233]